MHGDNNKMNISGNELRKLWHIINKKRADAILKAPIKYKYLNKLMTRFQVHYDLFIS